MRLSRTQEAALRAMLDHGVEIVEIGGMYGRAYLQGEGMPHIARATVGVLLSYGYIAPIEQGGEAGITRYAITDQGHQWFVPTVWFPDG